MKKLQRFYVSALVALVVLFGLGGNAFAKEVKVTLLHTNDMHGTYETTQNKTVGLDVVAAMKIAEDAILVDAGDYSQGSIMTVLTKGAGMVRLMNAAGYDVVCLGSLIIAGSPTTAIIKGFSLGGGGELEDRITANAAAGKGFNEGGAGMPGEGPGGAGGPMSGPGGPMPEGGMPGGPMPEGGMPGGPGGPGGGQGGGEGGLRWAGAPAEHGVYRPLGIVFTTYGGGFYGSGEAQGTLAQLKLYLELSNIRVVGTFACCGKEYGPAGLKEGELPSGVTEPPVYYKDADGLYHAGSFFFHTGMENKPAERDILKAKALVADLVEDYFYSHDGIRKDVWSTYTTIS